jgi:biopolymer transport protein ExbD
MARARKKREMPSSELPMTPMIDVVFQLLIYFIVTIRPVDVYAIVDVTRPSPDKPKIEQPPVQLLRIGVFEEGFTMNDRPVSDREFPRMVETVAKMDKEQTVLILAAPQSSHERLVRVLDLCTKNELKNLSVLSAN